MTLETTTLALAERLGQAAKRRGLMLATAESCTAGGIGYAITAVAGSSDWFDRGFITYTNEAKREMLGVREQTLSQFGAVSCETAREMACGAVKHSRADAAVSVTGIAGPGGAVPGKPVGTVCFGVAVRVAEELQVQAQCMHFAGDRESVRKQTVEHALRLLIERLEDAK